MFFGRRGSGGHGLSLPMNRFLITLNSYQHPFVGFDVKPWKSHVQGYFASTLRMFQAIKPLNTFKKLIYIYILYYVIKRARTEPVFLSSKDMDSGRTWATRCIMMPHVPYSILWIKLFFVLGRSSQAHGGNRGKPMSGTSTTVFKLHGRCGFQKFVGHSQAHELWYVDFR